MQANLNSRTFQGSRSVLAEVPNFKKYGTPLRNAVLIVPIFDEYGELEFFLGSQSEVLEVSSAAVLGEQQSTRIRIASLPRRQREVLAAMIEGKRNKQIAHELGICLRTVKIHRATDLRSLGT